MQTDYILVKFGYWGGGGHWDLRYAGGIFLRYFGIFLEKLRYYDIGNLAVHGICNFGLKNCGN
jgi:hypothetical protein